MIKRKSVDRSLTAQDGMSIVEVLISILMIALIMIGVYGLIIFALKITAENKSRLGALMLAEQKMEQIRNLPYASVGTLTGYIHGSIPDNETVTNNNGVYTVNTIVLYYDDPFDGLSSTIPQDTLPTDYKLVRIRASWTGSFGTRYVETFSLISPRSIETSMGGGTLSIFVQNANGIGVGSADVRIINTALGSSTIDMTLQTAADGHLDLPGMPASVEGYQIIASKSGYSTDWTATRTAENPNPTKPFATVQADQRTEISFAIDLLSDLRIRTVEATLPTNWQVNTDSSGKSQVNSRLAFDPSGNIYIVWEDYRQTSASKIYAQKYDASGNAQWPNPGSPAEILVTTMNKTVVPDVAVDTNGNLFIAWYDASVGNQEAYHVMLDNSDGSFVWGGEKKVNTLADSDNQTSPRIAVSPISGDSTSTVVFEDDRNGDTDIYIQRLLPDSTYLFSPEKRVNANTAGDGTEQYHPAVAADGSDSVYIAWTDDRNGNLDIYAARIQYGSFVWTDKKMNNDSGSDNQYSSDMAIDGSGYLFIVWTDERGSDKDIYLQKFDSAGNKAWTNDLRVNQYATGDQYEPAIAIASGTMYVVWTDERSGNQDIYAQKLDTDGVIKWTSDIRVNINSDDSDQNSPDVAISPASLIPYASWEDNRNGNEDIYASPFSEYTITANIPNVPLVVTGIKRLGENPIIYKYSATSTTDASGNIYLNNIEWDTYSVNLGSGYATYSIVMSSPSRPVELSPDTSVELILYMD